MNIDESLSGKELYSFLITNKASLITAKKQAVKHSDAFRISNVFVNTKGEITKSIPFEETSDNLIVSSVINTTNYLDSHKDVHLPGLWKKSLSENKGLYLLQEHQMSFKGIITDEVNAFTKKMYWSQLGYNVDGETEALIFNSTIPKDRNAFMYNEYKNGRVKNHSVGMRYVQIELAVNDEEYKDEFAVWNKYIDQIVNKEEAEAGGYFFAVKEAKVIEGSAVPIGSNTITPTLSVSSKSFLDTQEEPITPTPQEPGITHKEPSTLNIDELINVFKTLQTS